LFEPITRALARFSSRHPWIAIAVVVLLVGFAGSRGMPSMANDSAVFAPSNPAIAASERIDELFGSDSAITPLQVALVAGSGDIVTVAGLDAVRQVTEAIRTTELDGAKLSDWLVAQPGTGDITSFLAPIEIGIANGAPAPTDDASLKAMLAQAAGFIPPAQAGLVRGLFDDPAALDTGESGAGLVLAFLRTPAGAAEEEQLANLQGALAENLAALSLGDIEALPFSIPLIQWAGDQAGIQIPLLLFGAIGIIGLVLLALFFPRRVMPIGQRLRRTFADSILGLLTVVFAITTTNGLAVVLGPNGLGLIGNASGPAAIVPILVVGLGVDYVIHLNMAYRNGLAERDAVNAAMERSLRIVGGALVLSFLTTAFGFLTNLTGPSALATFGVLATVGIGVAFLYAMLLFPAARVLLDRRAEKRGKLPPEAFAAEEASRFDRLVEKTAVIPRRAPWAAVGIAGVVLVASAFAATNLKSAFSFLDFVPVDSQVRTAAAVLTERFGGGQGETTQVLVNGDLADPATWNATLDGVAAAATLPGVVTIDGAPRVQSPQALIAALANPDDPQHVPAVAAAVTAAGLDGSLRATESSDLASVIAAAQAAAPGAFDGMLAEGAVLYTFTTQAGTAGAAALAAGLEAAFPAGSVATSRDIIDAVVVTAISDSQTQSLLLAILAAGLLVMVNFFVSDRKPVLGILTIAPVAGIVILIYAFMALVGIPFGPVTATLAAIVIGIGIDYTIHVAHRFQEFRREGLSVDAAITRTLGTTGSALVGSALTTALGFAILTQSTLVPFQQLGVLVLAAVVGSALASIFVLPSMLTIWARWSERRAASRQPSIAPAPAPLPGGDAPA
jgi:predicted RND superfamily exporter protein